MVAHLFIGLIIIALAAMLITQGKKRRIWSILLLAALSVITYFFLTNLNTQPATGFIYQWLPYHQLRADFNISSSLHMQSLLQPLIGILALTILLNIINTHENYSLQISILNLLSFVLLILLASSHDFFQLIFASTLLSIISFYIPVSLNARKNFFICFFLAEFALFIALCVAYGSINTISLGDLSNFASLGHHKDFVVILILFSIACKIGLFPLNDQFNSLKDESFNRIIGLYLLAQPLAGLIILTKLNVLLLSVPWTSFVIMLWCLLTVIICLGQILVSNSFNLKLCGLFQALIAECFFITAQNPDMLYSPISYFLLFMLYAALTLYIVYGLSQQSANQTFKFNYFGWLIGCIPPIIGIIAISMLDLSFIRYYCGVFVFLYGICLKMFCSVNLISHQTIESLSYRRYWASAVAIVSIGAVFLYLFYPQLTLSKGQLILFGLLFITIFTPATALQHLGNMQLGQQQISEKFYHRLLLLPLRFFGRLLWLTFDFIFVERGIIATITAYSNRIISLLRLTQCNHWFNWILYFSLGILALILYVKGGKL